MHCLFGVPMQAHPWVAASPAVMMVHRDLLLNRLPAGSGGLPKPLRPTLLAFIVVGPLRASVSPGCGVQPLWLEQPHKHRRSKPIMSPFGIIFLALVSVPLIEIYLLISVGRVIGAGSTILVVLFTAVLGAWLLRMQGLSTLQRIQQSTAAGKLPATELVEGLILLVTGALLLTPGFFTDAIGFALLVPGIRGWCARKMISAGVYQVRTGGNARHGDPFHRNGPRGPTTIDGEYYESDPDVDNRHAGKLGNDHEDQQR